MANDMALKKSIKSIIFHFKSIIIGEYENIEQADSVQQKKTDKTKNLTIFYFLLRIHLRNSELFPKIWMPSFEN